MRAAAPTLRVDGLAPPTGSCELSPTLVRRRDAAATSTTARLRVVALLAVLAIGPYLNALHAGFTLDDEPDIRNNAAVTGGIDAIGALATPMAPGDLFRPLTVWTYAINEALAPNSAPLFHAVNILLHAIVTLLVCALATRLFGTMRVGVIAAMLFAVHPVHTEAVTNLVGRAELLAALFGVLALLAADPLSPVDGRIPRRVLDAVSIVCFALAILSKESGLVALPLLVLFRVVRGGGGCWRGLWREVRSLVWVPYALCAALFLLLRFYVVYGVQPPDTLTPLDNLLAFVPWTVRIPSALGVLWDYFGLLNVPLVLAADYSLAQVPLVQSWLDVRACGGAVLLLAAVLCFVYARQRAVGFAAAFPVVALSLTANLLFAIGTVKAERLLYLPSVGWVLLVAYVSDGALRSPRYRTIALAVLGVMISAFAARTWTRNPDWKDNLTMYANMARTAPNSAKARYNYGITLQRRGDDTAAVEQFERALAIYPYAEGAVLGIGIAREKRGDVDEAIKWYTRALALTPGFATAHTNLCHVLLEHQRFEAAAKACRNGLRYHPTDANMLKGLGASLVNLGATEKGHAVLRRSLALNPHDDALRAYLTGLESGAARAPEARRGEL